ncbi:UDP-N-acetylmuramoyl-L-alanyl-D-glutamate--2,6-diaminopimelate ligase [Belliella kenyensis]|uniref:UDP-N-acetylmuramoyl-L-alanyl-D-glutamate--2,6-diaminopimelate ligase n=1 Tax=Belliella kenyensis TaxID=1472724 RepID=A0ABV8ERI9_9BACT|nr:UDP-N-acetylmuramoyl-L-alanyl-D-glutamate--2,6-diaminopimelate ligase [Belliella kenyensis]MCH7403831.1 UDP-N-acetylmuramoyl-L-alanyl-D-glutamate--2,6-diaminopimelate ligase [Belliella kenyensis]MDN3602457.1 UDP-N-acetylmuramoyl-L-alanyl-D-glutamate--2,6-diaminopimelate ligase [Belliella kenyensis]
MKDLKDILYRVSLTATIGNMDRKINGLAFDSRKVSKEDVFVAVKGTQVDGHEFIDKAIAQGATVIICENLPEQILDHVTYATVSHATKALGIMASNYFENPSSKLKIVAITGTNGKTTTATLLYQLYMEMGYQVGLISTVENRINEQVIAATHTTPDALSLQELLQKMVAAGCTHCFMEASSHAIVQERLSGLKLMGAVFTNITHDHLDYHGTFDEYIKAKKLLFDRLPKDAFALTNADDKRGMVMLQNTQATKQTYGLRFPSDFKAKILTNSIEGLELDIDGKQVWFRMIGEFNAYNILAVFGAAVLLGEEEEEVLMQLSKVPGAQGRFDKITIAGVTAIVDYAHTPDALENVLKTIQGVRTGGEQVITVVGCGGNRDKTKRPIMAKIATNLSDKVVLTSDNPRHEEPIAILREMESGVNPVDFKKTIVIEDRREAIKTACVMANPGDIILIAGKGHETYQEIKGIKYPFDDRSTVKELLNLIHKS